MSFNLSSCILAVPDLRSYFVQAHRTIFTISWYTDRSLTLWHPLASIDFLSYWHNYDCILRCLGQSISCSSVELFVFFRLLGSRFPRLIHNGLNNTLGDQSTFFLPSDSSRLLGKLHIHTSPLNNVEHRSTCYSFVGMRNYFAAGCWQNEVCPYDRMKPVFKALPVGIDRNTIVSVDLRRDPIFVEDKQFSD